MKPGEQIPEDKFREWIRENLKMQGKEGTEAEIDQVLADQRK
jgi:hypothetical protein